MLSAGAKARGMAEAKNQDHSQIAPPQAYDLTCKAARQQGSVGLTCKAVLAVDKEAFERPSLASMCEDLRTVYQIKSLHLGGAPQRNRHCVHASVVE